MSLSIAKYDQDGIKEVPHVIPNLEYGTSSEVSRKRGLESTEDNEERADEYGWIEADDELAIDGLIDSGDI